MQYNTYSNGQPSAKDIHKTAPCQLPQESRYVDGREHGCHTCVITPQSISQGSCSAVPHLLADSQGSPQPGTAIHYVHSKQ